MSVFDKDRIGYGQPHPLIQVGAKGFFANSYVTLVKLVEHLDSEWARSQYGELSVVDEGSSIPYEPTIEIDDGLRLRARFQFFYVVEEKGNSKEYEPLDLREYYEMVDRQAEVIRKHDSRPYNIIAYRITKPSKSHLSYGEVLVMEIGGEDFEWITSKGLLNNYTFGDGSPIGKEKENGV